MKPPPRKPARKPEAPRPSAQRPFNPPKPLTHTQRENGRRQIQTIREQVLT